jgi:hypothetical protein
MTLSMTVAHFSSAGATRIWLLIAATGIHFFQLDFAASPQVDLGRRLDVMSAGGPCEFTVRP